MAYKTYLRNIGSTGRAGIGFLPSKFRPTAPFTGLADNVGTIQLTGLTNTSKFKVGDLVNVALDDNTQVFDTTITEVTATTINVSQGFTAIGGAGIIKQRFYPPKG